MNPKNDNSLMSALSNAHPKIRQVLFDEGITELYPPQNKAIVPGLQGRNLILSFPTASGKTLVAEILFINYILKEREQNLKINVEKKKIIYLCPLKALANEKYKEFRHRWSSLGINFGISTGDLDRVERRVFLNDVLILTNEKADSIFRNQPSLIKKVGMVVIDEIHLLHDSDRGVTLEFLLTRMKTLNSQLRFIGLSATIKNAQELGEWLHAKLIKSNWRPVELREGIYTQGKIHFNDQQVLSVPKIQNHGSVFSLSLDMIKSGGQILVFTNSRKDSISTASKIAPKLRLVVNKDQKSEFEKISDDFLLKFNDGLEVTQKLAHCLRGGVAFHHAGLKMNMLDFIVEQFNSRKINVIVCTPTLAAGVNTPARRVIIKSLFRYQMDKGMQPIPIMEYKQMAGRAGRPRFDPYGEVVILTRDSEKNIHLAKEFIESDSEEIISKLGDKDSLESHILSLIVSKIAQDTISLVKFLKNTFYFYQISQRPDLERQEFANVEELSLTNKKANITSSNTNNKNNKKNKNSSSNNGDNTKKVPDFTHGRGNNPLNRTDLLNDLFQDAYTLYSSNNRELKTIQGDKDLVHYSATQKKMDVLTPKIEEIVRFFLDNKLIIKKSNSFSDKIPQKSLTNQKTDTKSIKITNSFKKNKKTIGVNNIINAQGVKTPKNAKSDKNTKSTQNDYSEKYEATELGKITTRMYLPPQDAILLFNSLKTCSKNNKEMQIDIHARTWLFIIAQLKSFWKFYLNKNDFGIAQNYIERYHDQFAILDFPRPGDPNYQNFLQEIKLVEILDHWISEVPETEIVDKFNIGMGDLYRTVNTAEWLMRALREISKIDFPSSYQKEIEICYKRVKSGIKTKLIDFVSLKGIGRVRARNLVRGGFKSLDSLKIAPLNKIESIPLIGEHLAKSIKEQLSVKKTFHTIQRHDNQDLVNIIPKSKNSLETKKDQKLTLDYYVKNKNRKK